MNGGMEGFLEAWKDCWVQTIFSGHYLGLTSKEKMVANSSRAAQGIRMAIVVL